MSYKIVNRAGRYLDAFHSNGGFEIKDVFAFSKMRYIIWDTREEAEAYLRRIAEKCEAQRPRWGNWTDTALKFAKTLRVKQ